VPAEGFWGGWVGFAGVFMLIMGTVELCEGLIAILRDRYYAQSPQQIVVFDLKTWGWITLIWGDRRRAHRARAPRAAGLGAGSRSSSAA
jgi:hypothetical protein